MDANKNLPEELDGNELAKDLKVMICEIVDSLVNQDADQAGQDFEHFLLRTKDLVHRKQAMEGAKHDTRDLIGEVLFSRLRRGLREFLDSDDAQTEIKAAEWVIGTLFSVSVLSEFAAALDRAIIESSTPKDFSFAGRTDFINMEEVMQMLGAGKHRGCLSLEKDDNRLDIYMTAGHIAFLDPHHMIRRALPTANGMSLREISAEDLAIAERRRVEDGTPTFLALRDLEVLGNEDLRNVMSQLGREVFYDFLRDQGSCLFFYRRLDEMPQFVDEYDLRIGVTGILLEGSRWLDDWFGMCKVFPDPDAPVQPLPDMYSRISDLNLGVLEIKLLAQVNGENTPRGLTRLMGLPLHDVYQYLVRLARDDVIVAPGGLEALNDLSADLEDSMKMAFEFLDANDDANTVSSVLDKVLGGGDEPGELRTQFLHALRDKNE